jgi:hypothetical protein
VYIQRTVTGAEVIEGTTVLRRFIGPMAFRRAVSFVDIESRARRAQKIKPYLKKSGDPDPWKWEWPKPWPWK